MGGGLFLDILAGIVFLCLWDKFKKSRKKICLASIPCVLFFMLIILTIFKTGFNSYVIKEWICFVVYCLATYIVAIYVVMENKIRLLIFNFKWLGLIASPFLLQYSIKNIIYAFIKEYTDQFAGVVYLTIAYSALIILLFCAGDLFIMTVQQEKEHYKRNKIINLWNIILCSISIAVTGSRGVFVSLLVFWILMFLAMLVKKCKNMVIVLVAIPLFVFTTIFVMERANQSSNRVLGLVKEIGNNEINKAMTSEESRKIIELIQQGLDDGKSMSEVLLEAESDEEIGSAVKSITIGSMARIYLYRLAIKEANNHRLTGLGPLGYQMKYGIYPHNIVLECLSDLGYPITIFFVIFILYLIIKMFEYSENNSCLLTILIISLTQGIGMMFSGDLYVQPYLIWIITFVLAIKIMRGGVRETEELK